MVTLVACSDGTGDTETTVVSPTSSSQPSVAVRVGGAPAQPSRGSRAPVGYDPCVSLSDSVVAQAGFDPLTRERADLVFDDYALIGCEFDRKEQVRGQNVSVGFMTVSSTNVSLDEFKQRESGSARSVNVGGRDAITYRPPADGGCFVVIAGPDAAISIHVSSSALTPWNACENSVQIAETIEAALPK
ncbi:DUF3558 domain-containing protein [Nocardia sp. NPDC058658]|uniref:DUF3558 domain-containing protein n=1 Tax=Nocardia sp. NPDC058658 TaxID=3346580 RepID=UPI00365969F3